MARHFSIECDLPFDDNSSSHRQSSFPDRASELRQSNRRHSFTAAVAPDELISSLNITDIVSSTPSLPDRPPSPTPPPSTDGDSDVDTAGEPSCSLLQPYHGSSGSVFLRSPDLRTGVNGAYSVEECYNLTWRQPLSTVEPLPSRRCQSRLMNRISSGVPGAMHCGDPVAGDGGVHGVAKVSPRASPGSSGPSSPVPRSSSLMRAISGGQDNEECPPKSRKEPPTLVTYQDQGCGVASRMCCRWFFSWPIGGERGRLLTRVLLCVLAWSALATVTGKAALPGPDGYLFGIAAVIGAAALGGYLVHLIRLPPLLGMLLAGFLLRNVGVVDIPSTLPVVSAAAAMMGVNSSNLSNMSNVTLSTMPTVTTTTLLDNVSLTLPVVSLTSNLRSSWSSALRSVALVIILARAGLGLDPSVLRKAKYVILRLAFLPCLVEATVDAGFAVLLLDNFTWVWGYVLGFVIAAVSPAVVVPSLLGLQERGYGVGKGIPTLVIAAASFDDVIAISGFGIALGLVFSTGNSLVLNILRGPLELIGGIGGGTLVGIIGWYIPSSDKSGGHHYRNRVLYLLLAGLTAVFGTRLVHFTGAGALGSLVMAFVAARGWSDSDRKQVARAFALMWHFAQPMLFGLIGAEIDSSILGESFVGKAIGILWLGMLFRIITSVFSVTRYGLTTKEKAFVALAWLPKATVQAAIGSLALDTATEQGGTPEQIRLGKMVLTIAVLVIVFTAPIGSIAISLSGPRLLAQGTGSAISENHLSTEASATVPDGAVGHALKAPASHVHESAV